MTEFSLSLAGPLHVDGISAVLTAIARAGLRRKDCCPAFASDHYVLHPDQIACTVALDGTGRVLGFQSLKRAGPANTQSVPPGWGVIGTDVCPTAARQGVGRALFAVTRHAAQQQGIPWIDATMGFRNEAGHAFYLALGFQPYATLDGAWRTRFQVAPRAPA